MIELIPAIDMIDGKCVRLTQGDYNTKQCISPHFAQSSEWSYPSQTIPIRLWMKPV